MIARLSLVNRTNLMTSTEFDLARLVPKNLYALRVSQLLRAARDLFEEMGPLDVTRARLDGTLRDLADAQGVAATDLFTILRVLFQWPAASPDLLETTMTFGSDRCIAAIEQALTRLSDVAVTT